MIRTKGETGTGNIAEAVRHIKQVNNDIRTLRSFYFEKDEQELIKFSRELKISYSLIKETAKLA